MSPIDGTEIDAGRSRPQPDDRSNFAGKEPLLTTRWSPAARWLLLLPAAIAASAAVRFFAGIPIRAAAAVSGSTAVMDTTVGFWTRALLYFVLPNLAFVAVGGLVAPRHQVLVATVLTLLAGVCSLLKHIIVQHSAGNSVGTTNYLHFGLEMTGLIIGVVCMIWLSRRHRKRGAL